MLSLIPGLLLPLAMVVVPFGSPHQSSVGPSHRALRTTQQNWRGLPYSGSVLYATALRNGWVRARPALGQFLRVDPNLKCKKPFPCAFPNVDASDGAQPVNETPIAANPANHKQLITGGNDYNCGAIEGYYVSSDAGKTWVRSCGQLINGSGDGDPIVGFNLAGVAYRGGIDAFSNGTSGIIVSGSTDGGNTWSTPVVAAPNIYSGGLSDKPWLQIDTTPSSPNANAMYVSVTQFDSSSNSEISVSHSTDGGQTWTTVPIGQHENYPIVNQFSDVATGPDGTVYVTWMRCDANGPSGDCAGTTAQMLISKSTDGGNTWSAATTIESVRLAPGTCGAFYGCLPNTNERVSDIPATAVDESKRANKGALYTVAYTYTGSYMQVTVATSLDGGTTWAAPVAVAPPTDTHDQFFPWVNYDSKQHLVGATWLDRRNDPSNVNYEEFGGISSDGGSTFTDIQIGANPSNPNNDGFSGGFMGDYTGNSWDGTSLYASWTDTTLSHAEDFVGGIKL